MKVLGRGGQFRGRRYCDGQVSELFKEWKASGFDVKIPYARREGAQNLHPLVPGHLDISHHHERLDNNDYLREDIEDCDRVEQGTLFEIR